VSYTLTLLLSGAPDAVSKRSNADALPLVQYWRAGLMTVPLADLPGLVRISAAEPESLPAPRPKLGSVPRSESGRSGSL